MSKIFVVLERSYEYNDEGYEAQEGGNAIRGFARLQDAHEYSIEKTIKRLRTDCGVIVGIYIFDVFNETGVDILYKNNLLEEGETYLDYDSERSFAECSDEVLRSLVVNMNDDYEIFFIQELEMEE